MTFTFHEVIRTVGVILSLVLSAIAIWFSWLTYRQSNEDVRFSVYPSGERDLVEWADGAGNRHYSLDRSYRVLFVNLSTQSTSVVTMFASDARPGGEGFASSPSLLEGIAEKPFHPILLGAGESREIDVVYRERLPKECEFTELKAALAKPISWDRIKALFDARKRTFPWCDAFPGMPVSISHEQTVFSITTARGLRRIATTHEFVKFDNDGRYSVTTFTPDLN